MTLGHVVGYVGHLAISQTTSTLVLMTMINSGISILAGSVIVGNCVYYCGKLIYHVIASGSGMVIQKINDLSETKELTHSTVKVGEDEFELLDYSPEVIEINLKDLNADMFNQLDSRKLYRFIGSK